MQVTIANYLEIKITSTHLQQTIHYITMIFITIHTLQTSLEVVSDKSEFRG